MKNIQKEGITGRRIKTIGVLVLSLVLALSAILGFYNIIIPETVSCFSGEALPSYLGATAKAALGEVSTETVNDIVSITTTKYQLFGVPLKSVSVARLEDVKVYAGGVPFGIKFFTKGATVVGFDDENSNPAHRAGLRLYDTIVKINGKEISGNSDLAKLVEGCEGKEISLTYLRAGKENTIKFVPKRAENEQKYTLGLWLKDSGAGIGTLTYVLENGSFGGLGHGICESETGELVHMQNGSVLGVTINGIIKGQRGAPGELKGYFNSSKLGSIYKNTDRGVFGVLAKIPSEIGEKSYSLGLKDDIKEGGAKMICTLDDNIRREYDIEISGINRTADGNKCFNVEITDRRLLERSGGIVQGMSGSPIIQNGKLVGAVTHVLINDPSKGYGIFIENMLSEME